MRQPHLPPSRLQEGRALHIGRCENGPVVVEDAALRVIGAEQHRIADMDSPFALLEHTNGVGHAVGGKA